jgi:hypothetical protein
MPVYDAVGMLVIIISWVAIYISLAMIAIAEYGSGVRKATEDTISLMGLARAIRQA